MTERECAAIIISLATAVQLLVMIITFVCKLREQEDELQPSFRPLCHPPRRKKRANFDRRKWCR